MHFKRRWFFMHFFARISQIRSRAFSMAASWLLRQHGSEYPVADFKNSQAWKSNLHLHGGD
jgi:hypothetical protein